MEFDELLGKVGKTAVKVAEGAVDYYISECEKNIAERDKYSQKFENASERQLRDALKPGNSFGKKVAAADELRKRGYR